MRLFTTIFIIFLCVSMYGQDYYFTTAESGLNVRSGSDLSSQKVAKIPFGMMVEKIADTDKELVINDNGKQIRGTFVKIKYNNYTYLVSEVTESFEREGYVFDGYLKKARNDDLVTITKINKAKFTELSQGASEEIQKPKVIRNKDTIKTILKNRVAWVIDFDSEAYKGHNTIKSITTEKGQILIVNQNSNDAGFSEGYSGYYPAYDILVLEGGHASDISFSIKTGETTESVGNPEYIIPSPKNSYRLNGSFGGHECISYFLQKNENGRFVYLTELNWDHDVCTFKAFYWISETSFIYSKMNYMINAETEEYYKGEIKDNVLLSAGKNGPTQNFSNKLQVSRENKASEFIKHLENRENLSSFFAEDWTLIYHRDNRCDGATDGQIDYLKSTQVDSIINFRVTNDGDSWACEQKEPSSFDFDFSIKEQIINWDRFEILNEGDSESAIWHVFGAGESDYLKLHYNDANLITKLEYRSEDPG